MSDNLEAQFRTFRFFSPFPHNHIQTTDPLTPNTPCQRGIRKTPFYVCAQTYDALQPNN
jgi:hypothetical protein